MIFISAKMKEIKEKLEYIDKGTDIAHMQGALAGFKKFIEYLLKTGHHYSFIDTDDAPTTLDDIDSEDIERLIANHESIKEQEWWAELNSLVKSNCENIKTAFLNIDKARDFWYYQGFYKAVIKYQDLIKDLYDERLRREKSSKVTEEDSLFRRDPGDVKDPRNKLIQIEAPVEEAESEGEMKLIGSDTEKEDLEEEKASFDSSVCENCGRNKEDGCSLFCRRNTQNSEDVDLYEPMNLEEGESEEMIELSETMEYIDPSNPVEPDIDDLPDEEGEDDHPYQGFEAGEEEAAERYETLVFNEDAEIFPEEMIHVGKESAEEIVE